MLLRLLEVVCVFGLAVSLWMIDPWFLLAVVSGAGLVFADRFEQP